MMTSFNRITVGVRSLAFAWRASCAEQQNSSIELEWYIWQSSTRTWRRTSRMALEKCEKKNGLQQENIDGKRRQRRKASPRWSRWSMLAEISPRRDTSSPSSDDYLLRRHWPVIYRLSRSPAKHHLMSFDRDEEHQIAIFRLAGDSLKRRWQSICLPAIGGELSWRATTCRMAPSKVRENLGSFEFEAGRRWKVNMLRSQSKVKQCSEMRTSFVVIREARRKASGEQGIASLK